MGTGLLREWGLAEVGGQLSEVSSHLLGLEDNASHQANDCTLSSAQLLHFRQVH